MDKTISKTIKDRMIHNVVLKITSVIFAVLLWLFVINIDDPQTTVTVTGIQVNILNESAIVNNGDAYDVLSGKSISVRVSGPRTLVDSLKAEDFYATADFQELSKTNAVPINVSLKNARYEIKTNIISKSDNVMKLSIEKLIEAEYDVQVEYQGNPASGYVVYSSSADTQKVKLVAPKSVQERISKVAAVVRLTGSEKRKFDYKADIVVYNEMGGIIDQEKNHITIKNSVINVNTVVYYHKSVDIYYNTKEELSEGVFVSKYIPSKKKVEIYGKKQNIEDISRLTIPDVLLKIDGSIQEIYIDLRNITPEDVYIKEEDADFTLQIEMGEISKKSFSVNISEIAIKKIPEGYESSIINTGEIELVIEGREEHLKDITLEQLAPYIELEGATKGENEVTVNIVNVEGVELSEEVKVTASLTEKVAETEETTAEGPSEAEKNTTEKHIETESTTTEKEKPDDVEEDTTRKKQKKASQEETVKKTAN